MLRASYVRTSSHSSHRFSIARLPYLLNTATLGCSFLQARRGMLRCGRLPAAPLERLAVLEEERVATESAREEAECACKEARTRLDKLSFALVKEEAEFAQLLFGSKGLGRRVAVVRHRQCGLLCAQRGPQ